MVTALTGVVSLTERYDAPQPKATSGWVAANHDQYSAGVSIFKASQLYTTVCSAPVLISCFKSFLATYNREILTKKHLYSIPPAFLKLAYILPFKAIPQSSDEEAPSLRG
ncbi:hypothetical protein JMN32_15830 [Fulvivirga sp. 29W222]|uniref:Uncharacterized protein n=1 Tax=Fulvivirga marina TaxID=2494733 RepID=A0A937FX97_9BACT|nr:hypothetical protein [Fulvivirga marina]MBL6447789.1 hypothetical protein [Fulvivirga marina]